MTVLMLRPAELAGSAGIRDASPMHTGLTNRHRRTDPPVPESDPPMLRDLLLAGESPHYFLWITAARTHREHCVSETQVAHGHLHQGIHESICRARFMPVSMMEPPGTRCRRCEIIYREWLAATQPPPRTLRRRVADLFRRRRPTR